MGMTVSYSPMGYSQSEWPIHITDGYCQDKIVGVKNIFLSGEQ